MDFVKNLMLNLERWSRVVVWGFCLLGGCGEGVQYIQEGDSGGVVLYVYKGNQGHLVSPLRAEAFKRIDYICSGSYKIIKEGPAQDRQRVVEGVARSEIVVEKRWGIRFRCL